MEINFEEILDKHIGVNTLLDLKKQLVLEAMKEVWNKAIEAAADNAEADFNYLSGCLKEDVEVYVLKNSILKLKV